MTSLKSLTRHTPRWPLLERTWFTRVWIIQEPAVSQEVFVLCGEYESSWDDFMPAVDMRIRYALVSFDNTTRIERVYRPVIATGRPAWQAQARALGLPGLACLCMACLNLGAPYTY